MGRTGPCVSSAVMNIWKVILLIASILVIAVPVSGMNQPNDLAIAENGLLFASDPNWADSTGRLWNITLDGDVILLEDSMGTTNGIEVSTDGMRLYVN